MTNTNLLLTKLRRMKSFGDKAFQNMWDSFIQKPDFPQQLEQAFSQVGENINRLFMLLEVGVRDPNKARREELLPIFRKTFEELQFSKSKKLAWPDAWISFAYDVIDYAGDDKETRKAVLAKLEPLTLHVVFDSSDSNFFGNINTCAMRVNGSDAETDQAIASIWGKVVKEALDRCIDSPHWTSRSNLQVAGRSLMRTEIINRIQGYTKGNDALAAAAQEILQATNDVKRSDSKPAGFNPSCQS